MADFFKIYSGDYSQEGYEQGINDSKEHRAKNRFKFFKAVNPINCIWAFNNAYDSFSKNYDKGYLDGQRVEHQIYSSLNQTKGVTMQKDSYTNHIAMLENFKESLQGLKREIQLVKEQYKKQIDAMENAGFMEETVAPLKNKYQIFSSKIDEIDRKLAEHDQKIEIQKEALNTIRATARIN